MEDQKCYHGVELDQLCGDCQVEFENSRIGQERSWIKPEEEAA